MITLATPVAEQGTAVVDLSFQDEGGNAVIPVSVTWTLTDAAGTVVNSRSQVALTPASTVSVVLKGDDLTLGGAYLGTVRKLLVEATYNSTLGSGLPLKEEITFVVEDFVAVPGTG